MQCLKLIITIVVGVASIISCGCWIKSAIAEVPRRIADPAKGIPGSHLTYGDGSGKEIDLIETAKLQSKWNRLAAAFAAIAAVSQAVLTAFP